MGEGGGEVKKHKDPLSNTSIKRAIGGKYNKVERTIPFVSEPIDKKGRPLYERLPTGWRRIKYKEVAKKE
jgi:hypothetical protein